MYNYNQYSKSNYYSSYVNEQYIEEHGKPIPFNKIDDIKQIGKNSICKIKYYEKNNDKYYSGTGFFFQQNISKIQFYQKYFLMTNNHVLNEDFFKNNNKLLIEFKNKDRQIPLNNRIKYTNEKLDFTIIEILKIDSFFDEIDFLTIDGNIMDNNSEKYYIKNDIFIFQFPKGELSFDKAEIKSINDYIIKHSVSTDYGSSGSPILLFNNFKIIGIHNKRALYEKNNLGIFMKNILNDFKYIPQNTSNNNNNKNRIFKSKIIKIKKGVKQ